MADCDAPQDQAPVLTRSVFLLVASLAGCGVPGCASCEESLKGGAIKRANVELERAGWDPIPEGVTFHSLRRSYASLMAEAGADPAYTMKQIGHRKAAFTLEIYTDAKTRRDAANARLAALLVGAEKARKGANGANDPLANLAEPEPETEKTPC